MASDENAQSVSDSVRNSNARGFESADQHIDQSAPYEWRAVELDDRTLVVHDVPEGTARCFVVSAISRNVRALSKADAVLYNGQVTRPEYDESTHSVEFYHDWAGRLGRERVDGFLTDPAVRLKKLPSADMGEVIADV